MKENKEGMQIPYMYTGKISTAIKAADELQLSMYRSHATVCKHANSTMLAMVICVVYLCIVQSIEIYSEIVVLLLYF